MYGYLGGCHHGNPFFIRIRTGRGGETNHGETSPSLTGQRHVTGASFIFSKFGYFFRSFFMQRETPPKGYEPGEVENRWYKYWEERGLFHGEATSGKPPFCIVIPPPNVTGSLHMGHALNNTLQDILCRYKRMKGYNVLWQPGTDHAGIATQNVVEKDLTAKGTDRHKVGREKFIELVWEWRKKYGGMIINQLKRLGSSCDWSRELPRRFS